MTWRPRLLALTVIAATAGGCGVVTSDGPVTRAPEPAPRGRTTSTATRPIDGTQAQRLQRLMIPLIQAMNNPRPLNQVKVGLIDDDQINAASAGGGQFYVTRGLLEKADDRRLMGVLAHEIAHDDLNHVARAQAVGVGLSLGTIILDQIFPGSGAITPIAGQLLARGYSRNEEYAADRHGVTILRKAGHDKDVMIDTLTWLTQTSGPGRGGFFSTHPATGDRIEALRSMR